MAVLTLTTTGVFWLRCNNVPPLQPLPSAAGPDLAIRLHAQPDAHDNPAAEGTFLGRG